MKAAKNKRKKPGRRKLYFQDLVGPCLEAKRLRGNSPASIAKDRQWIARIAPLLGKVPARELTAGMIERALETIARGDSTHGPLKGSTVNRYHAVISSVLKYAARQTLLKSNPLAGGIVPWSKEQKIHVRYLGADEEARLLRAIREDCPLKEPEMRLALLTGMRRGEQFQARWDAWDAQGGILHVFGKTGAREVQVSQAARECLEVLRKHVAAGAAYITPERNTTERDRRTWLENAVKKAELRPAFHWRDLRHSFASRAAQAGESLLKIQGLLGHASYTTTTKYAHLGADDLRKSVEKVKMFAREVAAGLNEGDYMSPLTSCSGPVSAENREAGCAISGANP
jgi:integrase